MNCYNCPHYNLHTSILDRIKKVKGVAPKVKSIFTVAHPQVHAELMSWTAAALIASRCAGTDVLTAMIHHSTDVLGRTGTGRWEAAETQHSLPLGELVGSYPWRHSAETEQDIRTCMKSHLWWAQVQNSLFFYLSECLPVPEVNVWQLFGAGKVQHSGF